MDFMLPLPDIDFPAKINFRDPILFAGSCFTGHMGNHLQELKIDVLQNPHGILFDPASLAAALISYIHKREIREGDLFYLNECWQSWQHHGDFSDPDREAARQRMNQSITRAHDFLARAKWLFITLGSAFSYRLRTSAPADVRTKNEGPAGQVANCHRAPAQWFNKHLMAVEEINADLDNVLYQLQQFNPGIRIVFTVSPVRHIRDGVVENNRSKARLIEVVHHLTHKFDNIFYFPAYELVIDVLRDYRFYDLDLVHPNHSATRFVLEQVEKACLDEESRNLISEVKKINLARKHRPMHPGTEAHRRFLADHYEKAQLLQQQYPMLDFREEISYFSKG